MPMIDVTAATGTFQDKPALIKALAEAIMRWEQVPPIDFFSENTAAFLHELPSDSISNAKGESNYVRINVLTPAGGWGIDGHAYLNAEIADTTRRILGGG